MGLAKTAFAAAGALAITGCATIPSATNNNEPRLSGTMFMTPFMHERLNDLSIIGIGNELRRERNGYIDPLIIASQRDMEAALRMSLADHHMEMTPEEFYTRLRSYVRVDNFSGDPKIGPIALSTFHYFLTNAGMLREDFESLYGDISIGSDTNERLRLRTVLWILENRPQAFRFFDTITLPEDRLCLPYGGENIADAVRQQNLFAWRDVILEEVIHTREDGIHGPREEVATAGLRYDLMIRHFGAPAADHIRRTLAIMTLDRLNYRYYAQNANSPQGIAFDSHPYNAFIDIVDGQAVPEPYLGEARITKLRNIPRDTYDAVLRGQALANVSVRDIVLNFTAALRTNSPDEFARLNRDIGPLTRQYIAATLLLESGAVTNPYALELLREYIDAYQFIHGDGVPHIQEWLPIIRQTLSAPDAVIAEHPLPTTSARQTALQERVSTVFNTPNAVVGVPNHYVALSAQTCGGLGPQPPA